MNKKDGNTLVCRYVLLSLTEEEKEFVDRALQEAPRFLCGERKFPRIVKESFVKAAQTFFSSSEREMIETPEVQSPVKLSQIDQMGYDLSESSSKKRQKPQKKRKKLEFKKIVWYKIDPETLNFLKENTCISRLFKICYLLAAKKVAELLGNHNNEVI